MRASELMGIIPGITVDHLHNWERQGYLDPGRISVGRKRIRDYTEREVRLVKAMWSYYQKGLSPRNAYRNAAEEVSKGTLPASPLLDDQRGDDEAQEGKIDSILCSAIFELAIPLRHYFHIKMSEKESGWLAKS
jgi:DNA-binding transcriptional MerR regulator